MSRVCTTSNSFACPTQEVVQDPEAGDGVSQGWKGALSATCTCEPWPHPGPRVGGGSQRPLGCLQGTICTHSGWKMHPCGVVVTRWGPCPPINCLHPKLGIIQGEQGLHHKHTFSQSGAASPMVQYPPYSPNQQGQRCLSFLWR